MVNKLKVGDIVKARPECVREFCKSAGQALHIKHRCDKKTLYRFSTDKGARVGCCGQQFENVWEWESNEFQSLVEKMWTTKDIKRVITG